mmetsp:Transcript_46705/g.98126  ORF Transcript_46705/g.98126 Transcript_46705/m.98126 type:complete len:255 (-) Transcript_46705:1431-2195(-)
MRHKVSISDGKADSIESWDEGSPAITPHSVSSGMSHLTTNTPYPNETTPLGLDLKSDEDITKDSERFHHKFVDGAIKYKVALAGTIFLIFFMCSYTFLLGRHDMNQQLQYEDNRLLQLLSQKENILSNVTIEERDLLQKIKLLLDRLEKSTAEKTELVDKVARLEEDNDWLRSEIDELKEKAESIKTQYADKLSKATTHANELVEKLTRLEEDNDFLRGENENLKEHSKSTQKAGSSPTRQSWLQRCVLSNDQS